MKNKKLNTILFMMCFCAILPQYVEAKEQEEKFTIDIDKWIKKADEIEDAIVYNKIPIYKQDSLWLITNTPNVDPNEERNYYFIDKNNVKIKYTTYYDKEGNEIEENSENAIRKCEQKQYLPITLKEESFVIRNQYDLINGTVTTNYIDFDMEYSWEEFTYFEYGRFTDVSSIIPEEMQKEKYSAYDLNEILEIINDPEYEIFIVPLERTLK